MTLSNLKEKLDTFWNHLVSHETYQVMKRKMHNLYDLPVESSDNILKNFLDGMLLNEPYRDEDMFKAINVRDYEFKLNRKASDLVNSKKLARLWNFRKLQAFDYANDVVLAKLFEGNEDGTQLQNKWTNYRLMDKNINFANVKKAVERKKMLEPLLSEHSFYDVAQIVDELEAKNITPAMIEDTQANIMQATSKGLVYKPKDSLEWLLYHDYLLDKGEEWHSSIFEPYLLNGEFYNNADQMNYKTLEKVVDKNNWTTDEYGRKRVALNLSKRNPKVRVVFSADEDNFFMKYMSYGSQKGKLDVVVQVNDKKSEPEVLHLDFDDVQFKTYSDGQLKVFDKNTVYEDSLAEKQIAPLKSNSSVFSIDEKVNWSAVGGRPLAAMIAFAKKVGPYLQNHVYSNDSESYEKLAKVFNKFEPVLLSKVYEGVTQEDEYGRMNGQGIYEHMSQVAKALYKPHGETKMPELIPYASPDPLMDAATLRQDVPSLEKPVKLLKPGTLSKPVKLKK